MPSLAEAIGRRLKLPAVPIPADVLMLPGYFGFLANLVTLDTPSSNAITRQTLGWKPTQPGLFAIWTMATISLPAEVVSAVATMPTDSQVATPPYGRAKTCLGQGWYAGRSTRRGTKMKPGRPR